MCELLALVCFILNLGHFLTIALQLRENVLLHSPEHMLCDFLIDLIDFISYYFGHISQFRYSAMPCHFNRGPVDLCNLTGLGKTQLSSAGHPPVGGGWGGDHRTKSGVHKNICYRNSTSSKGVMEESSSG